VPESVRPVVRHSPSISIPSAAGKGHLVRSSRRHMIGQLAINSVARGLAADRFTAEVAIVEVMMIDWCRAARKPPIALWPKLGEFVSLMGGRKCRRLWSQREPLCPRSQSKSIWPGFTDLTAVLPKIRTAGRANSKPRSVKFQSLRVSRGGPTRPYFRQPRKHANGPRSLEALDLRARRPQRLSASAVNDGG